MSVDKLINYDQGEDIIEALGDISDKLDDLKAITPADFGLGYAVCDTPAATAAKTATLANYVLTEGAPVSVKFTYANTASNATLNLNSTGAKPIYYKGSAIGNDVISAGDICTFIYSTTVYNIINIDTLTGAGTGTVTQVGAEGGIITDQSSNADITRVGKVKLNLKDTTPYGSTAPDKADTTKIYPVALDDAGHPAVGVPWTDTTYTQAADSAIIVDNTNHTIDVAAATTSAPGVVQLENSYSSTSTTTSAVPNAVKAAYDLANGKYTKPQTGIPAEDLATAVQTSLTAADNAVPKTRTVNSKALSSDITLTAADVGAIATTAKGANGGVAELDANGKVPSSQLPSYVDDVLEYSSKSSFPSTGETGKIYVDTSDNKTYRWGGSTYVEISASLALGDTSSTAYYGDKGKTAYDHATESGRLTTATASGLYKVASTAQGHIASLTPVAKSDITGLGIPGTDTNTHRPIYVDGDQLLGDNATALNIAAGNNVTLTPNTSSGMLAISAKDTTYSNATTSAAGLMSAADKTKLNGIATGAQVNSITGVKGNSESTYRTGNVNLTPANIGAVPTTRTINDYALDSNINLLAPDIGSTIPGWTVADLLLPIEVAVGDGSFGRINPSRSYACTICGIASVHVCTMVMLDIVVGTEVGVAYIGAHGHGSNDNLYPLVVAFYNGTPIAGVQCYMKGDSGDLYVKPLQSAIPSGTVLYINGTYLSYIPTPT